MKERPILFRGLMVRAILAGRKTQTRRILKHSTEHRGPYNPEYVEVHKKDRGWAKICPYGAPGDRLWVRETWTGTWCYETMHLFYAADGAEREIEIPSVPHDYSLPKSTAKPSSFAPSIHMPRWASRITLEITGVRVERVQDISEADARAEGCDPWKFGPEQRMTTGERGADSPYRGGFACLWDEIYQSDNFWKRNPWVWVVEFRKEAEHGA